MRNVTIQHFVRETADRKPALHKMVKIPFDPNIFDIVKKRI